MRHHHRFICMWALLSLVCAPAWGTPTIRINLNDFIVFPCCVTVASDGSSALMKEDESFADVFLINDPGLGDQEVIVAAPGRKLQFEFEFYEAPDNDDEFTAFVLDADTGNSVGPDFFFFSDGTSSGTVSFDLTTLVGGVIRLGLSFQLSAYDSYNPDPDLNSTVRVSNVRLVPEPTTLALLGIGLAGIGYRRHRSKRAV